MKRRGICHVLFLPTAFVVQTGRRQIKQSGVDSMGVWVGVSPPKSGVKVWGHNLKLIVRSTTTQSQKYPREKKWDGNALGPDIKLVRGTCVCVCVCYRSSTFA